MHISFIIRTSKNLNNRLHFQQPCFHSMVKYFLSHFPEKFLLPLGRTTRTAYFLVEIINHHEFPYRELCFSWRIHNFSMQKKNLRAEKTCKLIVDKLSLFACFYGSASCHFKRCMRTIKTSSDVTSATSSGGAAATSLRCQGEL